MQNIMNRNEQEYYRNIARVARSLEDITVALMSLIKKENEKETKNKN